MNNFLILGQMSEPVQAGILHISNIEPMDAHIFLRDLKIQWLDKNIPCNLVLLADFNEKSRASNLKILKKAINLAGFEVVGVMGEDASNWSSAMDVDVIDGKPKINIDYEAMNLRSKMREESIARLSREKDENTKEIEKQEEVQSDNTTITLASDTLASEQDSNVENETLEELSGQSVDFEQLQSLVNNCLQKVEETSNSAVKLIEKRNIENKVSKGILESANILPEIESVDESTFDTSDIANAGENVNEQNNNHDNHYHTQDVCINIDIPNVSAHQPSFDFDMESDIQVEKETSSHIEGECVFEDQKQNNVELEERVEDDQSSAQDHTILEQEQEQEQEIGYQMELDFSSPPSIEKEEEMEITQNLSEDICVDEAKTPNIGEDKKMEGKEISTERVVVVEQVKPIRIQGRVRSGQVISHAGDIIIEGCVHSGGEVVSSGDIHIYGSVAGRLIAGAKGDVDACIYVQDFSAEFVSIAGHYHIFEDFADEWFGKSVKISLIDGALNIEAMDNMPRARLRVA